MLKKGILASTNFYASIAHSEIEFDRYFNELDTNFKMISKCETDFTIIGYEHPIKLLVFVQLSESIYMNAAAGFQLTFSIRYFHL